MKYSGHNDMLVQTDCGAVYQGETWDLEVLKINTTQQYCALADSLGIIY